MGRIDWFGWLRAGSPQAYAEWTNHETFDERLSEEKVIDLWMKHEARRARRAVGLDCFWFVGYERRAP